MVRIPDTHHVYRPERDPAGGRAGGLPVLGVRIPVTHRQTPHKAVSQALVRDSVIIGVAPRRAQDRR
jgi:hypothetical protein